MKKPYSLKKIFYAGILGFLLILTPALYSQSDGGYGTTSNLSYGVGARAMGLGRAYVAVANDPTAVFWNPAGLELVPRATFTLFHNQLFESTIFDFAGFAYPTLTYGTVGIGLARLGTSDIIMRDEYNVNLGSMNYDEAEAYIAYGKKLPMNLYGGFTFKIRRQSFTGINEDDTGFGFDIGLMYRPGWEEGVFSNIGFGLTYRNLVSPILRLGSESDQEPYHLTFGVVKGLRVGESDVVNVVFDVHKSKLESATLLAGTEYVFRNMGAIRLGIDNMNLAFGAGVKYSFVELDYSFGSTISDGEFPPTHRFSLTFDIGKSREELLAQADEERRNRELELVSRTKEEERQNLIAGSMEKGREYLKSDRYFDAYSEFQQVISVDPFNKEANVLLDSSKTLMDADLARDQQRAIGEAVDKELAENNAKLMDQYFERGQDYLLKNQFTDALVQFRSALEFAPENPTILNAISNTNRRIEEEVRKLVSKGAQQFQDGNYSEALQTLSDALVLAPEKQELKDQINTLANRIKIQQYTTQALDLFDQGRYEDALKLFEDALKMDPSNELLRNYVERSRRGMGAPEESMDPESERKYIQGVDMFLGGKYRDALTIWKELETKYPYNKKLQDAIKSAEERLKRTQQ
jgi:tetratricopeptide (TPR) repeat protein